MPIRRPLGAPSEELIDLKTQATRIYPTGLQCPACRKGYIVNRATPRNLNPVQGEVPVLMPNHVCNYEPCGKPYSPEQVESLDLEYVSKK